MLNLNYNIIGSVNIGGAQPFRAGAVYSVRNDIYSSSIVVAIPGNLFRDGDYQNQFGMVNSWDDISAYVKAGPNGAPIGSNLSVEVISSGSGVLYPTSSVIKWPTGDSRYDESLFVNSTSSLRVLTTFPAKQGANLSYSSSFVIEHWTAWNVTASLSASGVVEPIDYNYSPTRLTAYKYDPGAPSTAAYVWETTWGGDVDAGIGFNLVSGSARWIWDFNNGAQQTEYYLNGTSSFTTTPYVFNHYAVSYTAVDTLDPQFDRYVRIYINGIIQNQFKVPTNVDINQDPAELLQIFGALDTGGDVYAGRGQAYYQDFRMYNGTNKNYTGSLIPLPESMVVWN
jgi:hypothetical protein